MRSMILLLITLFFSELVFAQTQEISPSPDLNYLASIWKVHLLTDSNDLTIRIFETGGGDPAMNGNKLMLNLSRFPEESLSFNTHLNVFKVTAVLLNQGNQITIKVIEHFWDAEKNQISARDAIYLIEYKTSNEGNLLDKISIVKKS